MIFRISDREFLIKNSDSHLKRALILIFTIAIWWLSEHYLRPYCGDFFSEIRKSLGDGPFVRHVVSQSLPVDLTLFVLFLIYYKFNIIPAPHFRAKASVIFREGFLWGLLICIPTIPIALQLGFHLGFAPNWQSIAGNIISNFYEEFSYRFVLFSVAAYAFNNIWAGAIISALMFAVVHTQYPLTLQIVTGLAGLFFSIAYLRSGSLFAALVGHELADAILDSILLQ